MTDTELKKKIVDILEEIDDSNDYSAETHLIDDHILDSFAIISLVGELEENFGVRVSAVDMVPSNFNSADAIAGLVKQLMA